MIYALHDPRVGALLAEAVSHVAHRRLVLPDPVGDTIPERAPA